jgi:hypothetical protein
MVVIHTAYTIMKLPGPKEAITIESGLKDVLACHEVGMTKAAET